MPAKMTANIANVLPAEMITGHFFPQQQSMLYFANCRPSTVSKYQIRSDKQSEELEAGQNCPKLKSSLLKKICKFQGVRHFTSHFLILRFLHLLDEFYVVDEIDLFGVWASWKS